MSWKLSLVKVSKPCIPLNFVVLLEAILISLSGYLTAMQCDQALTSAIMAELL
jgi:hypothetical protein